MSEKDTCIFCRIVTGEHKEEIVYENQNIIMFLDRFKQPSMGGHILIIPREHYKNIWIMPETFCTPLMQMTQMAAKALKAVYPKAGNKIWISNGQYAGQDIEHLHVHLYPCMSFYDRFRKYVSPLFRRGFSSNELKRWAKPIRENIIELAKI